MYIVSAVAWTWKETPRVHGLPWERESARKPNRSIDRGRLLGDPRGRFAPFLSANPLPSILLERSVRNLRQKNRAGTGVTAREGLMGVPLLGDVRLSAHPWTYRADLSRPDPTLAVPSPPLLLIRLFPPKPFLTPAQAWRPRARKWRRPQRPRGPFPPPFQRAMHSPVPQSAPWRENQGEKLAGKRRRGGKLRDARAFAPIFFTPGKLTSCFLPTQPNTLAREASPQASFAQKRCQSNRDGEGAGGGARESGRGKGKEGRGEERAEGRDGKGGVTPARGHGLVGRAVPLLQHPSTLALFSHSKPVSSLSSPSFCPALALLCLLLAAPSSSKFTARCAFATRRRLDILFFLLFAPCGKKTNVFDVGPRAQVHAG